MNQLNVVFLFIVIFFIATWFHILSLNYQVKAALNTIQTQNQTIITELNKLPKQK